MLSVILGKNKLYLFLQILYDCKKLILKIINWFFVCYIYFFYIGVKQSLPDFQNIYTEYKIFIAMDSLGLLYIFYTFHRQLQ